ncbi:MAG: CYTH and CHAD domain-containing protein [Comamonadaceae bacterium]|nr:MAG: CYTH and CHAD domain-containing protein [Comamonadaceae bacterium]
MEIEFKFCIPSDRLAAVEAALREGEVQRTRLQARYFDTADHALAAQGIVLRLRQEGARWVQTAKAAGDGVLQRLEHNVDLGVANADDAEPQPDVQHHAGTAVGERLAKALDDAAQPLLPTYGTDIWRLTRTVSHAGCTAELALDLGEIHARDANSGITRKAPVRELELELLSGPVQGLTALAQQWAGAHGLWFSTVSKAEAGLRLLHGQTQVPAVKAQPPRYAADTSPSGPALLRAVVAACLAQVLPNASELAAGSEDAEQIHQLRVGLRRLRSALRELAPLAPDASAASEPSEPSADARPDMQTHLPWGQAWEPALVAAFRALGDQRDGDTVMAGAQARVQAAGGPPVDAPTRTSDAATAGDAVRAPALQAALIGLIGFSAEDDAADAQGPQADAALRHVRERLDRLHRRVLRAGQRFARLTPDERHSARKRLKRLRYLGEFVAPLFGARKSARYLDALRPAQEALGLYNDDVLALDTYRQWTAHDSRAWFGVGWLSAGEAAHLQACAEALADLREARPFWHARKKKR